MLRAAFIDVGGTLWPELGPGGVSWRDRQRRRVQELLGLHSNEAARLADMLDTAVAPWERPVDLVQDTDGLIDKTLHHLGLTTIDVAAVRDAMCVPASESDAVLFPHAPELLQAIRESRLRTILVSNTAFRDADSYWRDFMYFGVNDDIQAIITSLDVGYRKPHEAIFRAALDAAACSASECVVIGDSEEKDIAAAVAHGMRSILIAIEQPPPPTTAAHAIATSLDQARRILTSWVES